MPEGDAFTPGPYLGPHPSYLESALDRLDRGGTADVSVESLAMARADLVALGVLAAVVGAPPVHVDGVDVWWSV